MREPRPRKPATVTGFPNHAVAVVYRGVVARTCDGGNGVRGVNNSVRVELLMSGQGLFGGLKEKQSGLLVKFEN